MSTGSIASSLEGQDNYYITEHFTNTMALPYLMNRTHSVSVIPSICLLFVQSTGPLIHSFNPLLVHLFIQPLVHKTIHLYSCLYFAHQLQDAQLLKECQEVRKLLADLDTVYVEIIRDSELLQRYRDRWEEDGEWLEVQG